MRAALLSIDALNMAGCCDGAMLQSGHVAVSIRPHTCTWPHCCYSFVSQDLQWWSVRSQQAIISAGVEVPPCLAGSRSLLSLSRASSGGSGRGSSTALAAEDDASRAAAPSAESSSPQPSSLLGPEPVPPVAEDDDGPKAPSAGPSTPTSPLSSASGSGGSNLAPAMERADPVAAIAASRSRSALFVASCNLDDAEATVDRGFATWGAGESPSARSSLDLSGGGLAGPAGEGRSQVVALAEEASAAEDLKEMLKAHPPPRSRPASRRPSRRGRTASCEGTAALAEVGSDLGPSEVLAAVDSAFKAAAADPARSHSLASEGGQSLETSSQREAQPAATASGVPEVRAASLPLPGARGGGAPPRRPATRTKLDSFDKMLAKAAGGAQEVRAIPALRGAAAHLGTKLYERGLGHMLLTPGSAHDRL